MFNNEGKMTADCQVPIADYQPLLFLAFLNYLPSIRICLHGLLIYLFL